MDDIERVLISEKEIVAETMDIASKINKDYEGKHLLLLGLLKGSVCFMAELMKHITLPCKVDFMAVSSYGDRTESSGKVQITKDLSDDVSGYDVLIVEDIVDSGVTLAFIIDYIKKKGCRSVEVAALLNKPSRRVSDVKVRYCAKVIDDLFVVGFGMDYAEYYRNLPYIGVLKESVYIRKQNVSENNG